MNIDRESEGPADDITADEQATRKQWLSWLSRLEGDGDLDALRRLQIEGLDVWPIIKATIIMGELNRNQRTRFVARAPIKAVDVPSATDSSSSPDLHFDCDVLFLANVAPAIEIDGILLNPHLDPLRNALGKKGIRTLTAYYDSVPENRVCAFPSISLSDKVRRAKIDSRSKGELSKLQERLSTSLGGDGGIDDKTQKSILKQIENTLKLRVHYQQVFKSNAALKCLFVTNYYSAHGWGAVSAAKSLGIPTVDIQHGLQGRYHHAYSWPELKNESMSCVPDHFLCWTKHDHENLDGYPLTRGRSKIIGPGHFQLEKLVEAYGSAQEPASTGFARYSQLSDELLHFAEQTRSKGKKIAGIFLQYKEDEKWLELLRNSVPSNTELWVRRHPGVRRLDPNPAEMDGIHFVDRFPLTSVLNSVDVVVTGYSSVGIEAFHLGHPVVAYSPLSKEFLEPYCTSTGFRLSSGHPSGIASAISGELLTRTTAVSSIPDINSVAESIQQLIEKSHRRNKYITHATRYLRKARVAGELFKSAYRRFL
ncbi:CDP-glycerol glycerophosphotransferase family protein [Rhizobium sp. S96]|uniref:capsular polysaccharide export protein, LipB/KpsS family n=1 Tax=Rhizobium sp. S96 TaxID=3055140 RepID=UPI0025AB1EA6|nr:CDP-glycerol glycerophosphotransferase family protein [Rhizobium sp. S96]MDM9620889.1 CDP-glycerol glycerophosphotransferase family protein [Rhizobium sp. S96]